MREVALEPAAIGAATKRDAAFAEATLRVRFGRQRPPVAAAEGVGAEGKRVVEVVVRRGADPLAGADQEIGARERADSAKVLGNALQLKLRLFRACCRLQGFSLPVEAARARSADPDETQRANALDKRVDEAFQVFLASRPRLRIEPGRDRAVGEFGERALAL